MNVTETPDRLTALDGTFIELEDADPSAHMHIGGILVFAPRPGTGPPTVNEVRAQLEARLDALPRYRQRLADTSAGTLTWQRWIEDERFDIAHHVTAATLAAPGGWEQMLGWAGEYFSRRLDRRFPLWEVVVVGSLGDDHWALVTKTHHCMVDGIGSVDAAHLLLDGIADALEVAPGLDSPGNGGHLLPSWLSLGALAGVIGAGVRAATHPLDPVRRAAALVELLVREEVRGAPTSSINEPIGPDRILRAVGVSLDEVRLVKQALGGTVNDVVLATVCSGLRDLLISRGEDLPEQGLRAMVPMDVRHEGEHVRGSGNHISSLFVDLPVAEDNPLARYEHIRESTAAVKSSSQPLGTEAMLQIAGIAPPVLHHLIARTLFAKRLFNLTVTNVPGPQATLTAFGAPMKSVWPLVPLAADHALGIAIVSYDGQMTFGINADAASVGDVDVLAGGMTIALRELQRLAHAVLS